MHFTTALIAEQTGGRLVGPGDIAITGLDAMDQAGPGDLTFIGSRKYAEQWSNCKASAALVDSSVQPPPQPGEGRALIVVDQVDQTMARMLKAIEPAPPQTGADAEQPIHPTAVVDATAQLGDGVEIGPQCYVGPRVELGAGVKLYANVTVLDDSTIGEQSVLWPGVVVRERCHLGDRCMLHPNVTIGADGFGYRQIPGEEGPTLLKIPQIGEVRIGNDVEIGSGTCIDRAKFDATIIGDGCKIDNLCQIAHNCRLGRYVIIAGCTGLAGSVTVGDGAVIGGMCAFKDHITIGSQCKIAGSSGVMDDVPDGQTWAGAPAMPIKQRAVQELAVRQLPQILKDMRRSMKRDKKAKDQAG